MSFIDTLKNAGQSAGDWISNAGQSVGDWISNVGQSVGDGITSFNKFIYDSSGVSSLVNYLRDWSNEPAIEAAEADRNWQERMTASANLFSAQQADLAWQRNQESAREAMAFEADQARINREWQTEMSNTAYSRAVQDMKSTGLNPIFFLNGGGASTPSGSMADGSNAYASPAQGSSAKGSRADVSTTFLRDVIMSAVSVASAVSGVTNALTGAKNASTAASWLSRSLGLDVENRQSKMYYNSLYKKLRNRDYNAGYFQGLLENNED